MTMRPVRPASTLAALGVLFLGALVARAEDPYLGRIKAIKCVGCRADWVDIVVHDPLDMRDFEIAVKLADYYKVVSPLPGKNIHDKDGACFYWFEAQKGAPPAEPPPPPPPPKDSSGSGDSAFTVPPPLVPQGPPPKQSRCVPYTRPGPPAPKAAP